MTGGEGDPKAKQVLTGWAKRRDCEGRQRRELWTGGDAGEGGNRRARRLTQMEKGQVTDDNTMNCGPLMTLTTRLALRWVERRETGFARRGRGVRRGARGLSAD